MSDSGRDWGASSDEAIRARNRKPYDDIIRRRQDGRVLTIGKHTAANAATCERIISELEAAGMHDAAAWALWMVWWKQADSIRFEQLEELYREEIKELRKDLSSEELKSQQVQQNIQPIKLIEKLKKYVDECMSLCEGKLFSHHRGMALGLGFAIEELERTFGIDEKEETTQK